MSWKVFLEHSAVELWCQVYREGAPTAEFRDGTWQHSILRLALKFWRCDYYYYYYYYYRDKSCKDTLKSRCSIGGLK